MTANKIVMCHWGHTRRAEDGENTRTCPQCIERRIKMRVAVGLPVGDLLELWAITRQCETTST